MADSQQQGGGKADGMTSQEEQDLSVFVQNLLTQMQSRFQQMSEAIVTRIDEMGDRIDGLEKSIADLMNQAGVDNEAAGKSGGAGGDSLEDNKMGDSN